MGKIFLLVKLSLILASVVLDLLPSLYGTRIRLSGSRQKIAPKRKKEKKKKKKTESTKNDKITKG